MKRLIGTTQVVPGREVCAGLESFVVRDVARCGGRKADLQERKYLLC